MRSLFHLPLSSGSPRRTRGCFLPSALLVALSSVALCGCETGQIGGEVNEPDDNFEGDPTGSGCQEDESVNLTAGEESDLGFAPNAVFELVSGSHEADFVWGSPRNEEFASYELTPAAGEGAITITVTPDEASATLVHRSPPSSNGTEEGGLAFFGDSCPDVLRFDAEVHVESDNGAFDDTFTATFDATSAHVVSTRIPLDLDQLAGSFAVHLTEPEGAELQQLGLSITFGPGAMTGLVSGMATTQNGEVASAAGIEFGRFPAEQCQSGSLVALDSEYAQSFIGALDGLQNFEMTWDGSEPTGFSLAHDVAQICFEAAGALGPNDTVVLHVDAAAQSDDARIDGTWRLEARVTLDPEGAPASVELLRQAYLADVFPAASFEGTTGISGISLADGTYGSFTFNLSDDLSDSLPASGALTVLQVVPADCSNQEPVETEGGAASPGCAGSDVLELEGATFVGAE